MEMNDFVEKVRKSMTELLGEGYEVRIQEVQKNNGVKLKGLSIISAKHNVSPTIYLRPFWEAYEGGVTFAELMRRILQIYREDTPENGVDMSFFKDFDCVKDRICYRLIEAEKNRELLEKIPHIIYLNLAICFYYAYEGEALGNGTILIYHTHRELWQTDVEELMQLAVENTKRLFPWECCSMGEILSGMMGHQEQKKGEEAAEEGNLDQEEQQLLEKIPMKVLSNKQKVYGAACILYPGLLEEIAQREGANLYILPSSVHEVILMPDSGKENPLELKSLIFEVNHTQLEPQEILSDSLYYYNRLEKNISIII